MVPITFDTPVVVVQIGMFQLRSCDQGVQMGQCFIWPGELLIERHESLSSKANIDSNVILLVCYLTVSSHFIFALVIIPSLFVCSYFSSVLLFVVELSFTFILISASEAFLGFYKIKKPIIYNSLSLTSWVYHPL